MADPKRVVTAVTRGATHTMTKADREEHSPGGGHRCGGRRSPGQHRETPFTGSTGPESAKPATGSREPADRPTDRPLALLRSRPSVAPPDRSRASTARRAARYESGAHLGADAVVELTGLRNPCAQLDGIAEGLMAAVLDRDAGGNLRRKAGVMAIVVTGDEVRPGDVIEVEMPGGAQRALEPV